MIALDIPKPYLIRKALLCYAVLLTPFLYII